jgi:hypothetical protein
VLHAARRLLAGPFGDGPAVLARQVRQQPEHWHGGDPHTPSPNYGRVPLDRRRPRPRASSMTRIRDMRLIRTVSAAGEEASPRGAPKAPQACGR